MGFFFLQHLATFFHFMTTFLQTTSFFLPVFRKCSNLQSCWTAQWLGHCWRWLMQTDLLTIGLAAYHCHCKSRETQTQIEAYSGSDSCHYTYCTLLQTAHCLSWLVKHGTTAGTSASIAEHDDTMYKKFYTQDFWEIARSEQHWHSDAEIKGFSCSKRKIINKHTSSLNIPWTGLKMGVGGMICSS